MSLPVGLLIRTKPYPLGLWARVCSYPNPNPMGFLNPIQHKAIVILFIEFITNLISISFTSYFDESLMFCWWVGVLLLCSCGICICIWWICDFIWCCDHLNIELVIYIFIIFKKSLNTDFLLIIRYNDVYFIKLIDHEKNL